MDIRELTSASETIGIKLTDTMQEQLLQYAALLKEWNDKINLTAITEESEVLEKHFYDCLLALRLVNPGADAADVGTGAGFPGLVFKIACPEIRMTLIEPTEKKCVFLREVISQLNLKEVTVINERAEDYVQKHRESFDLVTARAVAALPVLAELCMPLVRMNGTFLAMKGSKGKEEARTAQDACGKMGCDGKDFHQDHLPNGDERYNLVYMKHRHTPTQYPRSYAKIKKKPLQ
ncbi:MAG: 16S rRNA (guanine(527)-N(7))-methyltransferase RsmG [Erysipelotrichia bacterium]|nr:16S rRNA (guanine(527)-N(7))-methyltransferase RsmG [Erysipelotrichia bacterium]